MKDNIEELEKELEQAIKDGDHKDKKTERFKWNDRKFKSLSNQSKKKPEYVLVEYLRANRTVTWQLCKVISGNIVVIDNKGHDLNPKDTWVHGKNTWYIIREIDQKPVSNRDYNILKKLKRTTDSHTVLIKMVLGAIQKKEMSTEAKKWIIWIIIGGIALLVIYLLFMKH